MLKLQLLKLLWRHGQRLAIYPLGFEGMNDILELGGSVTPNQLNLHPYEDITLVTEDDVKIKCYLIQKRNSKSYAEARGTIILFHGNSCDRGDFLEPLASHCRTDYNLFCAEYRGYGLSEGTPTQKGICIDAQAAVNYVHSHPVLSTLPITLSNFEQIVYGHSLGGAVAIHVTSKNGDKINALILENTFTSLPAVVRDFPVFGWPLSIFCIEKWPSSSMVRNIPPEVPILLLGGMKDRIVRPHHMRSLWRVVKKRGTRFKRLSTKKDRDEENLEAAGSYICHDQFILFPDGGHCTTHEQSGYWTVVHGYLNTVIRDTYKE